MKVFCTCHVTFFAEMLAGMKTFSVLCSVKQYLRHEEEAAASGYFFCQTIKKSV
jgi:hypothetical protein